MSEPTLNFMVQSRQVQLSVPGELIKKNLKTIQKLIEKTRKQLLDEIAHVKNDQHLTAEQKLVTIRKLIRSVEQMQRKLRALVNRDDDFRRRLTARAARLGQLRQYTLEAKKDSDSDDLQLDFHNEEFIGWLRDEANILVIDYLLKSSLSSCRNLGAVVAEKVAQKAKYPLADLIDTDVYESYNKVFLSITEKHDLELITAWYNDNRNALKKIGLNLEFEIHYCRYLYLLNEKQAHEAVEYGKHHLAPYARLSNYSPEDAVNYYANVERLSELGAPLASSATPRVLTLPQKFLSSMLLPSLERPRYFSVLARSRSKVNRGWIRLAECFTQEYTNIYGISQNYPLFVYLSAGLSCLKTKSCFCYKSNTIFEPEEIEKERPTKHRSSKDQIFRGPNFYYEKLKKINQCPVCSPELCALSRSLPYGLLITSIFNDPFMLPNGNIYPYDKLMAHRGLDVTRKRVYDPLTKEKFVLDDCVRVFPA